MRKPKVYSDTFGGDLANALLLAPVYRKPLTPTRKEVKEFDRHAELANLLIPVLQETNSEQWAAYEAGRVATAVLAAGYRKGPQA